MKTTLKVAALSLSLALAGWRCGGTGSPPAEAGETPLPDSAPIPPTAAEQVRFAGWVGTLWTPVLLDLRVQGQVVEGTATYVKVGKPIHLQGRREDGHYRLEESIDGKVTGEWAFGQGEDEGGEAGEGVVYPGQWRKPGDAAAFSPVALRPIRPLGIGDAELKRRYAGSYGEGQRVTWDDIDADDNPIEVEGYEEQVLSMDYLGSRHFSFTMSTSGYRGYGCGADGYLVMVAPDTAMFWGEDNCRVRFVFHDDSVSSQMLQWSSHYCGAGATGFDAEMKKN